MKACKLRLCLAIPGAAMALLGLALGGASLMYLGATLLVLALVPGGGERP